MEFLLLYLLYPIWSIFTNFILFSFQLIYLKEIKKKTWLLNALIVYFFLKTT